MKLPSEISHEAVVKSVENDIVTLLLTQGVSCAGCQAEKSCGVTGKNVKTIIVNGSYDLHTGDTVEVIMKVSQGYIALFLGYILPLLFVIITLVTLLSLKAGELISGLISFGILIPYYILLWFFRKHISENFSYNIKLLSK